MEGRVIETGGIYPFPACEGRLQPEEQFPERRRVFQKGDHA